ncbi:eukaryotic translation initiation factor 3 subunit A-like protein [Tanacetum coccineum]
MGCLNRNMDDNAVDGHTWKFIKICKESCEDGNVVEDTAHHAFQFCKQYKRTTEFRKLSEIIRNHLANLNKYIDHRDIPDLTTPKILHFYLDIRFDHDAVGCSAKVLQPS